MNSLFLDGKVAMHAGDCLEVLVTVPDASVDSIVTDPPYGLSFMGKGWDHGVPSVEIWQQAFRVLKPGGHLVAFSGTRTYHRMACAIEDAGFEIRDQIGWAFGSGFPKSHDVSKGIDRAAGAEREIIGPSRRHSGVTSHNGAVPDMVRYGAAGDVITAPATDAAKEWEGWGTALKPAWEPICLARKPLVGTVAENVLLHGTGAININGCRVGTEGGTSRGENSSNAGKPRNTLHGGNFGIEQIDAGRWPANLIHDGSEEVLAEFAKYGECSTHAGTSNGANGSVFGSGALKGLGQTRITDSGSAARFFYTAKADAEDRLGSKHPTVKPLDLMQWLVRLVTPRGGVCLDPFAGTGTTGEAAWREGMRAILIEREPEYQADIARRMELATNPTKRAAVAKSKNQLDNPEDLPLFASAS